VLLYQKIYLIGLNNKVMKNFLIQINKINKKERKNGFVLLYTMILASIILSITFGILNVALKETNFSVSARATNEAFFAADTGAECALYYDKTADPTLNPFNSQNPQMMIYCSDAQSETNVMPFQDDHTWQFPVLGLGSARAGCAIVTVSKNPDDFSTTVISKGYNNCVSKSVERELKVTY
jgi:hypothetical protein